MDNTDALRNVADTDVVNALDAAARNGPPENWGRLNALRFTAAHGLDEQHGIG